VLSLLGLCNEWGSAPDLHVQPLQVHGKELEQRLAQCAAELELARQTATGLERRLVGSKTKDEVEEMVRRMHSAEMAAAEVQKNHSELAYKAEVR
jgi:hypothetical protein